MIKTRIVEDGGIGRYALLPHTSKRRTTNNLKIKNNQNCQKIELYGSPTTIELKKKHSSRLVVGVIPPTQESAPEGPNSLVDSGGRD